MDEDEAELFLEYGADVNAKNSRGVPCVIDVAYMNPELLPWFKAHGAKLTLEELFSVSHCLSVEYSLNGSRYPDRILIKVLNAEVDFLEPFDPNFTVPIDNIPQISSLVDSIWLSEAVNIQQELGDENESFLTDSQEDLSKDQRLALFEKYPFIKELEKNGIDWNDSEEVEKTYDNEKCLLELVGKWNEWDMTPSEIREAIREIKTEIPYEDFKISPLDDALIGEIYDAATIYLKKGINVTELTKTLLLSVHDVSGSNSRAWNRVLDALKSRKDIDFSDVLLSLCKNHPKDDFDIAEEFLNNGYNFYRFANHVLLGLFEESKRSGFPDYNYKRGKILNEDGSYNLSPSIEDVRIRNNREFLKYFNETSFQDVNLRLIKNAISFGANPNIQDEAHKSALDYAKNNGIDESIFSAEKKHDIYDFSVDMSPSKKGAIRGHIEINGEIIKGSIAKQLIPEGKDALDYKNQKLKVILKGELQTKQAGDPYYKLDFAP